MLIPFDPVERARKVEKIVMKDGKRKYYRFRFAKYYGGIATADAVGCNLLCAYCWNHNRNLHPEKYGEFYSSEDVANRLVKLAERNGRFLFRISGAEPVLGERSAEHVVSIIENVEETVSNARFILETNGIMIGYNDKIVSMLSSSRNLMVRVSVKGWDDESFNKVTGARGEFFHLQLEAIRKLKDAGVTAWPAVMFDIFGIEGLYILVELLEPVGIKKEEIELEYLELYPLVEKNMRNRGLLQR